jgi:DNA primase
MRKISPGTVKEVSDRADLASLAGEYTRLEKRSGSDWWGCCPFHHEKTPSFKVDKERNLYHCFGCGVGGDVISFYREMEKLTFTETVVALANKSGIPVVYEEGVQGEEGEPEPEDYSSLYSRVAATFHYLLCSSPQGTGALEYIKSRGISDEIIARFTLGYAPMDRRWLKPFLRATKFCVYYLG